MFYYTMLYLIMFYYHVDPDHSPFYMFSNTLWLPGSMLIYSRITKHNRCYFTEILYGYNLEYMWIVVGILH